MEMKERTTPMRHAAIVRDDDGRFKAVVFEEMPDGRRKLRQSGIEPTRELADLWVRETLDVMRFHHLLSAPDFNRRRELR